MITVRSLVVLGLSIAAAACTADADRTETDTAAQTGAPASVPFGTEVSAEARGAAGALLHLSAMLNADPGLPEVAPFKEWVVTRPTDTFVESRADAGRTYYFDSDALHLVVEESWANPEEGPRYSAKLTTDPRPATATQLTGFNGRVVAPIVALAALAITDPKSPDLAELKKFASYDVSLGKLFAASMPHGSAVYSFEGTILEGGDIIAGAATLSITEMQTNPGPGPDSLFYFARATRTTR